MQLELVSEDAERRSRKLELEAHPGGDEIVTPHLDDFPQDPPTSTTASSPVSRWRS
jgi:hypothetical protein